MKRILVFAIVFMVLLNGCKSNKSDLLNETDIVTHLEEKGYNVKLESVDKDILSGKRYWITLDDDLNLSVFVYKSIEKAKKDASYVEPDGYGYNSPKIKYNIDWIDTPHFYRLDNIIVSYVGTDETIIRNLVDLYGEEFAGS